MCWEDYPVRSRLFWLSHCGVSGFVSTASLLQDKQQQNWLCLAARLGSPSLTAPWCSTRGCFLAPRSLQHISRWKSQYTLLTYSNYSWRENISHLTRLTNTVTVLYKIEHVYFNKAIHYKVRNQTAKRKYSRVLFGCFGISCRKSFCLSQSSNPERNLYSTLPWVWIWAWTVSLGLILWHTQLLHYSFPSSADNTLDK